MENDVEKLPEIDLQEFVKFNIKCCHFFGYFWPAFETMSVKKILYFVYITMFVALSFISMVLSQIAYLIESVGDMEKLAEASFLLFTNIVQCLKLYCFIGHGSRVWRLVHNMNNKIFKPQNQHQAQILINEMKWSKIIAKLFLLACTLTCTSWAVSPFLEAKSTGFVRLPLGGWYPYNTKKQPYFSLTFIYQIWSTWVCGLGDISMDTFMSAMIMFISAQLSLLNDALEKMTSDSKTKSEKLQNINLVRNILHHKAIKIFADEVNYVLNPGFTAQFVIGVIIICMSMFQMSLVSVFSLRFFAMFLYQSCVFTETYLFCFYGNEIILKSDQLTQSAYMSDWVDRSSVFKKNLIIFMSRTQFPLKLFASGYFTLSLETFKAISKSSWSYFAVLSQVHDQEG